MPKAVRKPRTKGDMGELDARLWRLFRLAEAQAHESAETGNGESLRKDMHACAAIAAQLRSSHKEHDQQERMRRIDEKLDGLNPMRKVI